MGSRKALGVLVLGATVLVACGDETTNGGAAGTGGTGLSSTGTVASGGGGSGTTGGGGTVAAGGSGGSAPDVCSEYSPVFPGDDWQQLPPAGVGLDASSLDAAMSYLASVSGAQGTEQALVIRCGYLVWQGSDIDDQHNVWSVTKSFTSTVLGLLVDDGACTPQTSAQDYLSAMQADYADVTLAHFATMTSGYDGGGDQSDAPFTPTAPLFAPGAEFQYWDSAMNQFANALTRIVGGDLESLFESRIAEPIGMASSDWDWGDWGSVDGMLVNGGAGNKSRGIHITARQLARFGLLMLHRGRWGSTQLLSADWVDEATAVQVSASMPAHTEGSLGPGVYGYNWWVNGIEPDGDRRWPHAPAHTYAALGFNHNRMYVMPAWGMVIVRLGTDGDPPTDEEMDSFFQMLAGAM